jgi:hypothetical protein
LFHEKIKTIFVERGTLCGCFLVMLLKTVDRRQTLTLDAHFRRDLYDFTAGVRV